MGNMAEQTYKTAPGNETGMPPGIPYIVGNEAAERFSFYGMKSILIVFMTGHLMTMAGETDYLGDAEAREWLHNFVFANYFFPILGAIIADWLFGKYYTILWLSMMYCAGHGVLALMDVPHLAGLEPRYLLIGGLSLIAIGSGGIKPCVSSHVGDQFGPGNKHLLPKVYNWFYFSINFGSFFSTLLIPYMLELDTSVLGISVGGPGWAFGIPGVLMAIATFAFWLGRHDFVHIPASGNKFWTETFSWDGAKAILNLLPLYLFIIMFWALFDQTASAWVQQAEKMDRQFLGFELSAAQIQAFNPLMVMGLIPLFTLMIYPSVNKLIPVTPLRKIGAGLFLTAIAFAIPAYVQSMIDAGQTPNIGWQVFAYLIITAAEVLVSITTLEFSYTQAPREMKSFVMGVYLLSISFANKFVALVNWYIKDEQGNSKLSDYDYYMFFTYCMLGMAVLYVVWAPFYQGRTYIQGESDEQAISPEATEEGLAAGD